MSNNVISVEYKKYFLGNILVCKIMVIISSLYIASYFAGSIFINFSNLLLPIILALVMSSFFCFRIYNNKMFLWCPLTWFGFSTSIYFGFGAILRSFSDNRVFSFLSILYDPTDTEILTTNLLNSISIFFVVLGYNYGSQFLNKLVEKKSRFNTYKFNSYLKRELPFFSLILLTIDCLIFVPNSLGLVNYSIPGFLMSISRILTVFLFLFSYWWASGDKKYSYYVIGIAIYETLVGVISFGKSAMLMPFIMVMLGFFWKGGRSKYLIFAFSISYILYTLIVQPISLVGRDTLYSDYSSNFSVAQRFSIASDATSDRFSGLIYSFGDSNTSKEDLAGIWLFWSRNSVTDIQAWLINEYDTGHPGKSLNTFFIALVPRALWPNKPVITNIGVELDAAVKNAPDSASSLAPTFNAEAYWNGGWFFVCLISFIFGLESSLYAYRAEKYLNNLSDLRYLPFAFLGIQFGTSLESWVIPNMVGGFATYLILWFIVSRLVRYPKIFIS